MGKKKRTGKMRKPKAGKARTPKKSTSSKHTGNQVSPVLSAMPDQRAMEKLLAGIGNAEGQDSNAVDDAQHIMYEAWEATDSAQRRKLALRALNMSPNCADAYVLLAQEAAASVEEARDLYQKGVEAGERALGPETFEDEVGYFWGLLETRPYMRARHGLAECLWTLGQREGAVAHYQDMLRLNPEDNQGIRDILMPCLIELGRDDEAERLFQQFEEDSMATWMYSRVLLNFRKLGDAPATAWAFKEALSENPHVPAYLLGRKKMPKHLPDYIGFGDVNEAVAYAYGNKAAWQATPGALEWLAGQSESNT